MMMMMNSVDGNIAWQRAATIDRVGALADCSGWGQNSKSKQKFWIYVDVAVHSQP